MLMLLFYIAIATAIALGFEKETWKLIHGCLLFEQHITQWTKNHTKMLSDHHNNIRTFVKISE